MIQTQLTIVNKLGLHARAAAKLVGVANKFGCDIKLGYSGKTADAKSIMAVMILAASQHSVIDVTLTGDDAQAALDALAAIVANRFDEDE